MSDQIEPGLTEEEVETYNSALDSFIKLNANYVDFTEKSDGFTYITMRYGLAHDEVLRELALKCKNGIVDNSFVIGQFNWTIVYANSAILRFKCSTNTIATKIENDAKTDEVLFKPTTASYEENFDNDVAAYIKHYITNNATEPSNVNAELGFSFYKYGNKTHLGIDCATLNKYATSHNEDTVIVALNAVCINTIQYYTDSPKTVTELLSNALAERKLTLEKVNSKVIIFGYNPDEDTGEIETTEILEAWKQAQSGEPEDPNSGNTDPSDPGTGGTGDDPNQNEPSGGDDPDPNDPGTGGNDDPSQGEDDPSGTSDEFIYEKTPGVSKYMILHYGNPTLNSLSPEDTDNFDVVVLRNVDSIHYDNGSSGDNLDLPIFVLVHKTDKSVIAADYAYPWIVNEDCTFGTIGDTTKYRTLGKDSSELSYENNEDVIYRDAVSEYYNPDGEEGVITAINEAKTRYFNAAVDVFKKVTTDHKILIKFYGYAPGEGDNLYLHNVITNTLREIINDATNENLLISSKDRTELLEYIKNYMAKISWGSESDVTKFDDASVLQWLENGVVNGFEQVNPERGRYGAYNLPFLFAIGNSDDTTIPGYVTGSGDDGPCEPANIFEVECGNSNITASTGPFGIRDSDDIDPNDEGSAGNLSISNSIEDGNECCRISSYLRFGDNIIRAATRSGRAIDIYFMENEY